MRKNRKKFSPTGEATNLITGQACPVAQLVREAVMTAVGDADIRVDLDLPPAIEFPVDAVLFSRLVQSLTRAAVEALRMNLSPAEDQVDEISVTAWQAGETLEVEVADNGPPFEQRPRYLPLTAAQLGADLVWQTCPQGGSAVTAIISRTVARRSAA